MKVFAVILAGGSGERFGSELPKQFCKLAGREVIEHTIDAFEIKDIDEIIVVAQQSFHTHISNLCKINNFRKVTQIISGGLNRMESTERAIRSLTNADTSSKILIHDAVRPLINGNVIKSCVNALDTYEAVDVIIHSSDTVVFVDGTGCIEEIPSRDRLRRGQTPQGFRLGLLRRAFELAGLEISL